MLVMHRDMKPANIMIYSLEPYRIFKLIDFGSAVWLRTAFSVATLRYCAPKIYHFRRTMKYSNKVDTFSIGMMALELLGFQLKDTLYGSQHAFDTSVGTLIESDMHFAITQEKVMALKALHVTTAYYPSNKSKPAACFQLWWFERSMKKWAARG